MDEQIKDMEVSAETTETIMEETAPKPRLSKKKLIIIGAILVIIAVVATILIIPTRFERVKNEAIQIAGQVSSRGDDNFTIDTYPYENSKMKPELIAMLAPDAEKDALEAIQYVNEELGFNGALYDEMLETNASMGRQSEENHKYIVTWTYHPDEGLEVTYQKK